MQLTMMQRHTTIRRLSAQLEAADGTGLAAFRKILLRTIQSESRADNDFDVAVLATTAVTIMHATQEKQIGYLIDRLGIDATVRALADASDIDLALGPVVIRSEKERGYWFNAVGWIADPVAATGYSIELLHNGEMPYMLTADARFVPFNSAVAFED